MANVLIQDTTMTAIGNAIRGKGGASSPLLPGAMPAAINSIPSGGGVEPDLGFVPTEWDSSGYVTEGKWVGTGPMPGGAFACYSRTYGPYINLSAITGLEGVTSLNAGNGFRNCGALLQVKFDTLDYVGSSCFQEARALEKCDIGSVNSLGGSAFTNCTSLSALIIRTTSRVTGLSNVNVFSGTPVASGAGYVYVPSIMVDAYKTATNWVTYANQIRAIEDYPEVTS